MKHKYYTSIVCPLSCYGKLSESEGEFAFDGFACLRGQLYAKSEYTDPVRMLTTCLSIEAAGIRRLPVVSNGEIPKRLLTQCYQLLSQMKITAPIKEGQIIATNILESNVDIIATRNITALPRFKVQVKIMNHNVIDFLNCLKEQLPDVTQLSAMEDRQIYAHGVCPVEYKWMLEGYYPHIPDAILMPSSIEEISRILQLANEFLVGIVPIGGASGSVCGTSADKGQVMLDVKRLRSFSINEINCTAKGGAGLTGADFENQLNDLGYTTGHFPQSFQSAVLGGMVATRAVGTFSTKYGKMDDMVSNLVAVLPTGEILRTHTAPKSSTGLELNQLLLGSEGVYGIVTEVEMEIYPMALCRYFEAYTFPSTLDGLEAIRQFMQLGLRPAVVRLYDHVESIPKIKKYCFEPGYSFLVFGYEGLEEQVFLEKKHIRLICEKNGGLSKGTKPGEDWFHSRFSTKKIQDYHAIRGGTSDAIEVAAPWDCIGNVWAAMREVLEPICNSVECHFSHVYHTGASVYVIFYAETGGDDFEGEKRYIECVRRAITASLENGGNISHHHGIGKLKAEYLEKEHGETGVMVMRKIKDALDPNGILNKGVLGL